MPSNNSKPQYSQEKSAVSPSQRRAMVRAFLLQNLTDARFLEGLLADPRLTQCYYRVGIALGLPKRAPRPADGDYIAWQLIQLGRDCGLTMPEVARWLMRLNGFPLWPDEATLAVLLRDAFGD